MLKNSIYTILFTIFSIYNLNAQMVNVTLEAHNVWGDGSGFQLLLDKTATQYGIGIPTSGPMSETCYPPENLYDIFSSKIPADAFPSCKTTTVVANGSVTIQIPAGVYDWCITNPHPGGRIWMVAGGGDNSGIRDNYLFEEGKNYNFHVKMFEIFDGVEITITDADNPCPKVSNVTASVVEGNKAKITWAAPPAKGLSYFKIYQNNVEVGVVNKGVTEWKSNSLVTGNYTFAVAAVYTPADDCFPVKVPAPVLQILTCYQKITHLTVDFDASCTKAEIKWKSPTKTRSGEVYNNGPFITHPGQGANGADASAYNAPFSSAYGVGANITAGYMIGDDFTLDNDYTIETIDFFAYQNGAGVTSTITGVYVQIYKGNPMSGGTLIWGNTTTNRMIATTYTNVNRVSLSTLTSTNRRIMKVTAEIGLDLFAGINYWLTWGFTGSLSDGPSQIPVTIFGQPETGNGILKTPSGWEIAQDFYTGAVYDFVFNMYGEKIVNPETNYNVYRDGTKIAGPINNTFYEDVTFDKFKEHTYSVAVVCVNGGDGEWTSIKKTPCEGNHLDEYANHFSIYPNPTSTEVIKVVRTTSEKAQIEIYNMLGVKVKSLEISELVAEINLSGLTSGVYLIRLTGNDVHSVQRFIKL